MSTRDPKIKVIYGPPPTGEQLVQVLFGMSTDELIEDIRFNKDGKWDCIYNKKGSINENECEKLATAETTLQVEREASALSVAEAAKIMGVTQMFLRIGLRHDKFPFGVAIKPNKRWSYYINAKRFRLWMEGEDLKVSKTQRD